MTTLLLTEIDHRRVREALSVQEPIDPLTTLSQRIDRLLAITIEPISRNENNGMRRNGSRRTFILVVGILTDQRPLAVAYNTDDFFICRIHDGDNRLADQELKIQRRQHNTRPTSGWHILYKRLGITRRSRPRNICRVGRHRHSQNPKRHDRRHQKLTHMHIIYSPIVRMKKQKGKRVKMCLINEGRGVTRPSSLLYRLRRRRGRLGLRGGARLDDFTQILDLRILLGLRLGRLRGHLRRLRLGLRSGVSDLLGSRVDQPIQELLHLRVAGERRHLQHLRDCVHLVGDRRRQLLEDQRDGRGNADRDDRHVLVVLQFAGRGMQKRLLADETRANVENLAITGGGHFIHLHEHFQHMWRCCHGGDAFCFASMFVLYMNSAQCQSANSKFFTLGQFREN